MSECPNSHSASDYIPGRNLVFLPEIVYTQDPHCCGIKSKCATSGGGPKRLNFRRNESRQFRRTLEMCGLKLIPSKDHLAAYFSRNLFFFSVKSGLHATRPSVLSSATEIVGHAARYRASQVTRRSRKDAKARGAMLENDLEYFEYKDSDGGPEIGSSAKR
ncbi:MAG: hypothetical protein NXY57DRAFT_676407 [Lentinula lateritia]|nr:MAG: hypothetical protein NXY57DRAFT_676407 [Lentinula lateritia]